jgi:hypothetical protein
MITHELLDTDEGSKVAKRKTKVKSDLNQHMSNLRPLRTFHMHSSTPLQLVITKTFLSMLDTISKTLQLNETTKANARKGESSQYEAFEIEEDMLMEKYQNRLAKEKLKAVNNEGGEQTIEGSSPSEDVVVVEDGDEQTVSQQTDENPSFNFLIKNELGLDLELEALQGFKFQNMDFVDTKRGRVLDKCVLKHEAICPITLTASITESYKSIDLVNKNGQTLDKKALKFDLNVLEFY